MKYNDFVTLCPYTSFLSILYIKVKPQERPSRFVTQTTCFEARAVLFGVRAMKGVIVGEICMQNVPEMDGNRQFQAKTPKYKNCNICETASPINTKFQVLSHTVNRTSWVVHHYATADSIWLTSTILKTEMT